MTNLDIYVFRAMRKAYSQGFLDGMDSAHSYGTENNFEEVLDEVLFCQEYAEVSREQLLNPEQIDVAAFTEEELAVDDGDQVSQEPDQDDEGTAPDDDKTDADAELSAEALE
jgi:hypothetical protein